MLESRYSVRAIEILKVTPFQVSKLKCSFFAVVHDNESENEVIYEFQFNNLTLLQKRQVFVIQSGLIEALEFGSMSFLQPHKHNEGKFSKFANNCFFVRASNSRL